ncbi:nucleotide sugar dehydrogenase [Haliscomenobacter hydrossis]|uniref:Nucleotide sugar dehydrogenase n=1 Tax=Haliscomenobacter hydrossis (strain ATCC 27775 / DSM 1100 / LMG 10767 / O) TaxID=760192 RepID=F4KR37_HALH1|nr:nucleotide sugar dehydrogenase [Haliscomenobacter hydrossis]AEE53275.1 nucleotide sugar dehydrogenase [Haliscomenobacter hydrossis DSM 1100]
MYSELLNKEKTIAVIGLGYVGLPLALELAKHFRVIGFDINVERVALMQQGLDPTRELDASVFQHVDVQFTADPADLRNAHFFIIAVPTDINEHKVPNLIPLQKASESVGKALKPGDYVVYESTVYPGCTEEDCLPILEQYSGLKAPEDFKIGYSPERINPGDKTRPLATILKVVSGCDAPALETIAKVYGLIITAGIYEAPSIKVAEAAKVIENIQRDLNISLVNELAMVFDKMDIDTNAVLAAAATKWNFHRYSPGLVGGHCIGVDPYYLLHKARQLGIEPQVIAAGRRINDAMPVWIAKNLVQTLLQKGKNPSSSKVLVMGITFKEDVADIRNSKVVDLVKELMSYSIHVQITDPWASPNEVAHEYKLSLTEQVGKNYDAIVLAVGHQEYKKLSMDYFKEVSHGELIFFDLKGLFQQQRSEADYYWTL